MLRYTLGSLLLSACVSLTAAPVPKRPPPPPAKLTADQLVGTFSYSWGHFPHGGITFAADGQYSASHDYNTTTAYFGTWSLEG